LFGWVTVNSSTLCGTVIKWLTLALLLISSGAAWGQQYCAPDRKPVIDLLHNKYNEVPVVRGLANNNTMLEVFASPEGSWTILVTRSDGVTCAMASGQNLEILPTRPKQGGMGL